MSNLSCSVRASSFALRSASSLLSFMMMDRLAANFSKTLLRISNPWRKNEKAPIGMHRWRALFGNALWVLVHCYAPFKPRALWTAMTANAGEADHNPQHEG